MYDLVIIGGGASGLLTAALAAGENLKTVVLERNNAPAKKIYATGNGHCNYLNEKAGDVRRIERTLGSIGIAGVKDEDGRFYPRSREASAVALALVRAAEKSGAKIICDCHVSDVVKRNGSFLAVSKDGRKFEGKYLVIATGGKAGIQFGCYGEGYKWAQYMGHSLVKPVPALVPVECEEDISALHGVRVKGNVSLLKNGETLCSESGEIQFTKDSISGICVMDLSGKIRLSEDAAYVLSVDLFPEHTEEELAEVLGWQKETAGSMLEGLLPAKLKKYIEDLYGDKDKEALASLLKDMRFSIKGTRGWADAQVTAGGVPLQEIDPDTMESLKTGGLYFTGEIIDYDGPCGGFNLANAWSTAIRAAEDIKRKADGRMD